MTFMRSALCLAAVALPASALAQDNQSVDILQGWSADPLYATGLSVDQLLNNADIYGPTGENIGTVENVIFSDSGEALAIIAQVGGVWDIGDTHVSVPWDELDIMAGERRVNIPITEDTAGDYSMFGDRGWFSEEDYFAWDADMLQAVDDDLDPGPTVFRASELIGDYAYLSDAVPYGYVNDLIVENGQVAALVVDAAGYYGSPGYYAYPYDYGAGATWNPYDRRYQLPLDSAAVEQIESFDYDRLTNRMDRTD